MKLVAPLLYLSGSSVLLITALQRHDAALYLASFLFVAGSVTLIYDALD